MSGEWLLEGVVSDEWCCCMCCCRCCSQSACNFFASVSFSILTLHFLKAFSKLVRSLHLTNQAIELLDVQVDQDGMRL